MFVSFVVGERKRIARIFIEKKKAGYDLLPLAGGL